MKKERVPELITPPVEYEGLFEQLKLVVEGNFLEITGNMIDKEKRYCLKKGLSLDQANHIITKALQSLSTLVSEDLG